MQQRIALILVLAITLSAQLSAQVAQHRDPVRPEQAHSHDDIDALLNRHDQEIHFTQNQGQFSSTVLYRADLPMGQAVATEEGMLMTAFDPDAVLARQDQGIIIEEEINRGLPIRELKWQQKGHGWLMHFQGASPDMYVESQLAHEGTTNYFLGDRNAQDVRTFQEIWYKDVYHNTDVRYYPAADGSLEYDIICKPGSNPSSIAIELKGIDRVSVSDKGELVMSTSLGDMSYPAPIVYQRINGREIPVKAKYLISGKNVIKFDLGDYDKSEPLVIDPIAMRWATWVNTNSSGDNHGHCIWVDPSDGAIYVVARVIGTTDQITVGAFDTSANGNLEIIIGKYLEPATIGGSGSRVWQTYVGGNGDENPYAMEQGGDGNLYISGYTSSTNFPLIGGPAFSGSSIDQQSQGGADVFVLKINTAGNSIKAAVIGGNSADDSYDLRVATNGDVIVCGTTTSTNLLTLNGGSGASNTNNGSDDALLFRVNGDLSSLIWMRNYGGSGTDLPSIMAQDPVTGDIFVGGHTTSTNFPTTAARQSTRGGTQAGFLQRLTSAGSTVWSSYFSSNSGNAANILCMSFNNAGNELYFGGVTTGLPSSNISTSGVYDGSHNGSNDLYVCRMGLDQTFISSTYVGGSGNEVNMMGLNTDQNDDVYVFGYTNSTNFPVSSGPNVPLQTTNNGSNDKVFFKLESDLSVLEFSTYYGGTGDDYDPVGERGIKFSNCRIYTIVTSRSNNIPLTQGALNTTRNSPTSRYEPGLVVWANPPDLLGNTITSPAYAICAGTTPNDIMGSVPSYVLPTIVRNNSASAYPALGSATTYQWQTSPDSLNWMNIPGATGQNLLGTQLGPIAADTYVRRVIGGDACILAGAADQVVSVRLMKIHATITNVTCNGAENGSISVTSNGLAPFTYAWSNGGTTDMITGLAPGSYTVMITDAAGCSETSTIQISEPPVLTGQTSTSSATCNTANGTASVVPTGGTAPYSYLWSNSATSSMISGVSSGPYTVTVTDAKECTVDLDAFVGETGSPTVDAGSDLVITCASGPQISLNGSGSAGVSFAWTASNGGNIVSGANTATTLVDASGTYSLTVTDPQTTCTATEEVIVTSNTAVPNIIATGGGELTCSTTSFILNGGSTTGGTSFSWSGPGGPIATTEDIIVNAPGTYTLIVTDPANGCTNSASILITQNATPPGASATGGTLTCSNTSVMLMGTGNGTFSWTGPNNFTSALQNPVVGLSGTYVLTVTGSNGCTSSASTEVDLDDETPGATATDGTLTCSNTSVMLIGSGNGTFSWTGPNNFTSALQNPVVGAAGTYVLTVTGSNGCTSTASTMVSSNTDLPPVTATGGAIDCETGTLQLTGSSPIGELLYTWNGSNEFYSTEQNPVVDMEGVFTLTVTAGNGCSNSVTVFVSDNCGDCRPLIEICGPDLTIECGTSDDPNDIEHPIFRKDPLCPEVTVYWTDEWFGGCPYTLIRTWYASDETGAEEVCIQTITVVDTQAPIIMNVPGDVTVNCASVPEASGTVWVTDACKDFYTVSVADTIIPGNCPGNYTIERTYWSEDDCGNRAEVIQIITVIDNVAPELIGVPQNIQVECSEVPAPANVTAYDDCDPNVAAEYSEVMFPGACDGEYQLIRTWLAKDNCGNLNTMSQTITVVDTQGPIFLCDPEDITVKCDNLPATMECNAYDTCSDNVSVFTSEIKTGDGCKEEYTITRYWTATDGCGNNTVIDQIITVVTNLPPTGEAMVVSSTPNPFRFQTKIAFVAPEAGHGLVEVYDLQGRRVAELFNSTVTKAQTVSIEFQPEFNGSGTFIYRVVVNGIEQRGRMVYQP